MGQKNSTERRNTDSGSQETERRSHEDVENAQEIASSVKNEAELVENKEKWIKKARFVELCSALQRLERLQRESTAASIDASQSHREASIKRQEVWVADANFMTEVQHLMVGEVLASFGELSKYAIECRIARDELAPMEQEEVEAEQKWEGTVWKLRQAEQDFNVNFREELAIADGNASGSQLSIASSPYTSSFEVESHVSEQGMFDTKDHESYRSSGSVVSGTSSAAFPPPGGNLGYDGDDEIFPMDSILLGIDDGEAKRRTEEEDANDWDSGFEDIDEILPHSPPPQYRLSESISLPKEAHIRNICSLDELLTDFTTVRERINMWQDNAVLYSRVEAMTMFTIIRSHMEGDMPSNWAQFVIANFDSGRSADERGKPLPVKMTRQTSLTAASTPRNYQMHAPVPDISNLAYAQTSSSRTSSHMKSTSLTDSAFLRPDIGSPISSLSQSPAPRFQQPQRTSFEIFEKRPEPP